MENREIKFRVFDKISKEMYGWSQIASISLVDFELEHYELMQYTGLKDKNGKEIYIDDLYMDEECDIFKVIQMECGRYALEMLNNSYVDEFIDWTKVEIIGNIYENRDLLK